MSLPLRVAVQQRVLPSYRAAFFDLLAGRCEGGLALFAGQPLPDEALGEGALPERAIFTRGLNKYYPPERLFAYQQEGLLQWLAQADPQVLVMETNARNLSLGGAVHWMHTRRRTVIGWGLGAPVQRAVVGWVRNLGRVGFIRRFDALITYSKTGAEEFQQLGFPEGRIFIAPNAATAAPKDALPVRENAFSGKPVVLFVGRLQARKKVDQLIQACAALPEARQPELVVVGDGPEKEALEKMATTLYPRARFSGDLRGEALREAMDRADLFVLPGTGGLAVQEAMSRALPVVVGEADGTQGDLVREGNGWLLKAEGVKGLVAILTDALSDPVRLRRMGSESYRIVKEESNLELMADAFERAIQMALN